jgi:hypothetical protein
MTLSVYECMRCKVWVTEEHEGPPVRAEQRVLCKVCCQKALDLAFGGASDATTCSGVERLEAGANI